MRVHKVHFNDPHPEIIGQKLGERTITQFLGVNNGAIPVYETRCNCGKKFKESYDCLFNKQRPACASCSKAATQKTYGPGNRGIIDPETLITPQQELFCQEYVCCWDAQRAAEKAGYSSGSGSGLMQRAHIRVRIEDLIKKQRLRMEREREDMPKRLRMDLARITEMLLRDREAALTGRVHIEGREPEPVPSNWRMDNGAAVKATMGIAQLHGLLIKRTEVTFIDAMETMNDHELVDVVRRLQSKLADTITIDVSPLSELARDPDEQDDTDAEN
jgi:hypothetical protein